MKSYKPQVKQLNQQLVKDLLNAESKYFVSIYLSTHPTHPDNKKDPIVFKNLVKKTEESLLEKYSENEIEPIIQTLDALHEDQEFWQYNSRGLAIFYAEGLFYIVKLHRPIEELSIVADSFHTKPLRKYLQTVYRYHVLGLTRKEIKLFEGNRHSMIEVPLAEHMPRTIEEALGEELTDNYINVTSHGGVKGESSDMFHGHGGRKDQISIDEERFFRVVSKAITETYSKPANIPLIVAALPEYHNLYQKVSKNHLLHANGIEIDPLSVSTDKLTKMAWSVMEPEYLKRMEDLSNKFKEAEASGKGNSDVEEVASAIVQGKVDTLLIEEDRIISKRITDVKTGTVEDKDLNDPNVDDLLDDMSELATKMGGNVVVLPPDKMPSTTGVAAIFRF
jgi:hypothetical protein